MPNFLVRIFGLSQDKTGETESGYFISEPDAEEALYTAIDAHEHSRYIHESSTNDIHVEIEEAKNKTTGFLSSNYTTEEDYALG